MPRKKKEETKEKMKVFSTNDMGLAASLSADGFQILKSELGKNNVVYFLFQQDEGIEEATTAYYTGNMRVNAHTIVKEMKTLRKVISAHMKVLYGEKKMNEREIDVPDDRVPDKKRKKGDKPKYAIGNDGFTQL